MIAKNGQYVLTKYEVKQEEINGIAVPEIHKSPNTFYRVVGFGLDNRNSGYVSLGDVVLCDNVSEVDNVMIGVDTHEFLLRREERIVAIVGHDENGLFPEDFHKPDITDEFEKKFKGYNRQDALNRIRFLERNRNTIERMNWERVNS